MRSIGLMSVSLFAGLLFAAATSCSLAHDLDALSAGQGGEGTGASALGGTSNTGGSGATSSSTGGDTAEGGTGGTACVPIDCILCGGANTDGCGHPCGCLPGATCDDASGACKCDPQTTPEALPTHVTNYPNEDTGWKSWTMMVDAKVCAEGLSAEAALASDQRSKDLQLDQFGFQIPDGSTISSVHLIIRKRQTGSNMDDLNVKLLVDGDFFGNQMALGGNWPTSFDDFPYAWSPAIGPAKVNSPAFGFVVAARNHGTQTQTAFVDCVRATVTYVPPCDVSPVAP